MPSTVEPPGSASGLSGGGGSTATKKGKKHLSPSEQARRKRKTCWYRFTQQQLPAWQPVLTPKSVVFIFYFLAVFLTVLGIVIYTAASGVVRMAFEYTRLTRPLDSWVLGF